MDLIEIHLPGFRHAGHRTAGTKNKASDVTLVSAYVGGHKDNTALDAVHRGDDPNGEVVRSNEAEFTQVLADTGRQVVGGMNYGSVPEAFQAWCDIFMERHEPIRGKQRDGCHGEEARAGDDQQT